MASNATASVCFEDADCNNGVTDKASVFRITFPVQDPDDPSNFPQSVDDVQRDHELRNTPNPAMLFEELSANDRMIVATAKTFLEQDFSQPGNGRARMSLQLMQTFRVLFLFGPAIFQNPSEALGDEKVSAMFAIHHPYYNICYNMPMRDPDPVLDFFAGPKRIEAALVSTAHAGNRHLGTGACQKCKVGNGPFARCVTMMDGQGDLIWGGACTNCIWTDLGDQHECSFSTEYRGTVDDERRLNHDVHGIDPPATPTAEYPFELDHNRRGAVWKPLRELKLRRYPKNSTAHRGYVTEILEVEPSFSNTANPRQRRDARAMALRAALSIENSAVFIDEPEEDCNNGLQDSRQHSHLSATSPPGSHQADDQVDQGTDATAQNLTQDTSTEQDADMEDHVSEHE